MTDEVDHIRQRYQRRAALPSDRYSFVNPSAFLAAQSLDRAVMSMLLDAELTDVFCASPTDLWRTVLRRQGGRLAWVANAPDDLSAN